MTDAQWRLFIGGCLLGLALANVLPSLPANNFEDGQPANAVLFTKWNHPDAGAMGCSNSHNIRLSKFRVLRCLASASATFRHSVPDVVSGASNKQMLGIDTGRVIAHMQDVFTELEWPMNERKYQPVNQLRPTAFNADYAIASPHSSSPLDAPSIVILGDLIQNTPHQRSAELPDGAALLATESAVASAQVGGFENAGELLGTYFANTLKCSHDGLPEGSLWSGLVNSDNCWLARFHFTNREC